MGSKNVWDTVKSILASKGFIHNKNIAINVKGKYITNECELIKTFNPHYISIVQNTT